MKETMLEIESRNRAIIQECTFGHLKPKPNIYNGYILFALTAFGDTIIIDFDFENVEASPWFNTDVLDYITKYTEEFPMPIGQDSAIFKFTGNYEKKADETCEFIGLVKQILTNDPL